MLNLTAAAQDEDKITAAVLLMCQKKYIKKIIAVLWVAVRHELRKKFNNVMKVKLLMLNKLCQIKETMKKMLYYHNTNF